MRVERRGPVVILVGGPVPPGADAITVGRVVSVRRAAAARPGYEALLAHEMVHVRQWGDLGYTRFLTRYVGAYLRWRLRGYSHWAAYARIPLEVEAVWESGR